MTRRSGFGLRGRLTMAFIAVALAAVAGQSALVLVVAGDRVSDLVERQNADTGEAVAAELTRAYVAAGGWAEADTGPATVLATLAGAGLEVRDAGGLASLPGQPPGAWAR